MNFPLDRMPEIQLAPERFKLVEQVPLTLPHLRFPVTVDEAALASPELIDLVLLDVETTGLDVAEDGMIELGAVRMKVCPHTATVASIDAVISWYDDPGVPVPEFITGLTGITQAMVDGQRIDNAAMADFLQGDPLIVAHNAQFDRGFFEKRFPELDNLRWACSIKDVDWRQLGFEGTKLEYLLLKAVFFYTGHRASIDCLALAQLLIEVPDALEQIVHAREQQTVTIAAVGAPFDVKDLLKAHGYRWFEGNAHVTKHWWLEVPENDLDAECAFLDDLPGYRSERARFTQKSARLRYKPMHGG